jgi:DNA-binding transcriptional LysR family regulator
MAFMARGYAGALFSSIHNLQPSLPTVLRLFRRQYPGVHLSLVSLPMTAQLDAVVDGRIDIGMLMLPVRHSDRHRAAGARFAGFVPSIARTLRIAGTSTSSRGSEQD